MTPSLRELVWSLWPCLLLSSMLAACGEDDPEPPTITFEVVSAALDPASPAPGEAVIVRVELKNTSDTTWKVGAVTLAELEASGFGTPSLALTADARPDASAKFEVAMTAPEREGLFTVVLRPRVGDTPTGATVRFAAEVTCSNGTFCDGMERWVDGACVAGFAPCDDHQACTTDTCDEAKDTCAHALGGDCAACFSDCEPDCAGKACGADGCGGSCGDCGANEGCSAANECVSTTAPGSCQNPLPLVADGQALLGDIVIDGDTSSGVNQVVPTCNRTSTSVEAVYSFTVTETVGFEAQSSGFDTVLHLRTSCLDDTPAGTVRCSDDSAPPGNYGSRISGKLVPGTYFLVIDGFDSTQFGPFHVRARFAAEGCVPNCDGQSCGGDDGCGNSCGECADGEVCRDSRCYPDPCTPSCERKACGDDGCGGTCGACAEGTLCVDALGTCETFAACDGKIPVCDPPCGVYSACHGHYHFHGFASCTLLSKATGQVVTGGQKFAYCMEDTAQYHLGPDVPCQKQHDCTAQGISPGWSDLYGNGLDCQWIDVTDVPAGDYVLKVDLNPGRTFQELTFENNSASIDVSIE